MNRVILIKVTLSAILLFQLITIVVLSSIVSQTTLIYLISFLVCQILLAVVVFEFIRSPWKGAALTIEEAEEELKNRLFEDEDIGVYDFTNDNQQEEKVGETTLIGLNKQEVVTADENMTALETNYKDPFYDLVKQLHKKSLAGDEKAIAGDNVYTAPDSATIRAVPTLGASVAAEKDFLKTPMESIPERPSYVPSDPNIENP